MINLKGMIFIIKNPLSFFLLNTVRNIFYCLKYKNLKIHSNVSIKSSIFENYNTIYSDCKISNSVIKQFTYIASDTKIHLCNIGSFCSIGPNCRIGLGLHPSKTFVSTHPIFFSTRKQCGKTFVQKNHFREFKKTFIGNDVWIGANTTIIDGVTIGNGAIIGANSTVTKNIPKYAIAVGSPARIIKFRFDKDTIEKLEENPWWLWDIEKLERNTCLFHDIQRFKDIL